MMTLWPASKRDFADQGWVHSYRSFSRRGTERGGYRCLQSISEDRLLGDASFPEQFQQETEILIYVLEGSLEYQDFLGNHALLRQGDLQRLHTGTGIRYAIFNPLSDHESHFLRIGLEPVEKKVDPSFEKKSLECEFITKSLVLGASPDGRESSVLVHQDLYMHIGKFKTGEERHYALEEGRSCWIQMLRGWARVNDQELGPNDALAIEGVRNLCIQSKEDAEFLLFDMD
jgi:redox-sensitive bicupin YhaK (pirin superfamily)